MGTNTMTLGSSYPITMYQSYYTNSEQWVRYSGAGGWIDYSTASYMIMATIEDSKNCHLS